MVINNEVFKSLTGGEPITARHLYQGERTFITRFKLYMNTNYLPLINDQAIFDSGRLQVLTFDRHFTEQEQDKTLKQKFRQKQNRAAILAWIIQGYKQYQEKGLAAPVSVQLRGSGAGAGEELGFREWGGGCPGVELPLLPSPL